MTSLNFIWENAKHKPFMPLILLATDYGHFDFNSHVMRRLQLHDITQLNVGIYMTNESQLVNMNSFGISYFYPFNVKRRWTFRIYWGEASTCELSVTSYIETRHCNWIMNSIPRLWDWPEQITIELKIYRPSVRTFGLIRFFSQGSIISLRSNINV